MQTGVELTGHNRLITKLTTMPHVLGAAWRGELRGALRETRRAVQGFTPSRTGKAKRRIRTALRRAPEPGVGIVFAKTGSGPGWYVGILARGSSPHRIPKLGKRPRRPMPVGGGRYAWGVMHPGTKPHDMFTKAIPAAEAAWSRLMTSLARRIEDHWGN